MHRRSALRWALALGAGGTLAAAGATLSRRRPVADPPSEICIVAPPLPFDPASGLSPLAPRPLPAEARCPVCGMYPARHPRWAAMVVFDDGAAQYFDSPAHLLMYLPEVPRHAQGRRAADIRAMHLADHDGDGWVPLDRAVLVSGSRALGPMRSEDLPAFASEAAAQRFIARAGGRAVAAAVLRDQGLPPALQTLAPHRHR